MIICEHITKMSMRAPTNLLLKALFSVYLKSYENYKSNYPMALLLLLPFCGTTLASVGLELHVKSSMCLLCLSMPSGISERGTQ